MLLPGLSELLNHFKVQQAGVTNCVRLVEQEQSSVSSSTSAAPVGNGLLCCSSGLFRRYCFWNHGFLRTVEPT